MRYIICSVNDGEDLLRTKFPSEHRDICTVLSTIVCPMKESQQSGKQGVWIFDPIGMNAILREQLTMRGWKAKVPLAERRKAGNDVDFYKNGVVIEAQFGNFAYLQSDVARLEALHTGVVQLRGSPPVELGVLITVQKNMPRANSVSDFEIATTRAVIIARTIPLVVFGLDAPKAGEEIILNRYQGQRSRTLISSETKIYS